MYFSKQCIALVGIGATDTRTGRTLPFISIPRAGLHWPIGFEITGLDPHIGTCTLNTIIIQRSTSTVLSVVY